MLTALVVTALVTVVTVAMASQQQLNIRRTANLIEGDRAYLFALGVESWAVQVLARDKPDRDHLAEDWAVVLPPLTVEGATVGGRIEDLQSRFNLNNLIDSEGEQSPVDVERFRRLLNNHELDPDLVYAVVDWIDKDIDVTSGGGAEDGDYLSSARPYRTANAFFLSPSELMLVRGFTREAYNNIVPYITALPQRTTININTAPAPVLRLLASALTQADADGLVEARSADGFADVNAMFNEPLFSNLQNVDQMKQGLDIKSNYFMVSATALFGRGQTQMYSIVDRPAAGKIRIVMRSQGAY